MPRQTVKYVAAVQVAQREKITLIHDAELLYHVLEERDYHWDSEAGEWAKWTDLPADEPTEFVMVRLWAAGEVIGELADDTIRQLEALGLRLMERSEVYPCRPPKQLEARVYLKFLPARKFTRGD
jgi:hypothetical protein